MKGTGISEKSFENLVYIQNKILKAKLKNLLKYHIITLNEGDHLSEEEYFEKQQWQKFNREPWELVEQIWKETSANRISAIHKKDESTISSTLLDWPILEHANGYSLRIKDKIWENVLKSVYTEISGVNYSVEEIL
ncbi:hypothetical protein Avbf_18173, partial [Armadillidium vulgare]